MEDTETALVSACSYAQRWLWALDSVVAEPSEYNVHQAVRVRGLLDPGRLRRAAETVSTRHELLRTRYDAVAGQPVPVLLPPDGSVVDTVRVASAEAAEALAAELITRPFDLTVDRPIRITAIGWTARDWLLVVCVHHIATDAWSMDILWRELGLAYDDRPLPPPPPPHADLVRREQALAASPLYQQQLAYWRTALADLAPSDIPGDRPRPARRSGRGATIGIELPAGLSDRLAAYARDQHTTVYLVVLAAVQLVLARWTGGSDIAVGTVVSGRTDADLESAMGYFVNTVVVRGQVDLTSTVDDHVGRVRDAALDGFSHADVPFAEIVDRAAVSRDISRNPLFDVAVTIQDDATASFHPDGLTVAPVELAGVSSKFDLSLMLTQHSDGLSAALAYATDLFDEATAHRFGRHVMSVLDGFCDRPDRPLGDVPLLDDAERHRVVVAHNNTERPIDSRRVHQIFADLARRRPDAPAVLFGRRRLSYGDLDRESDAVAVWLRRRGIGRGDRVAVRLDRTPALLAALFGVLKAEAAYVPIDLATPPERVAVMLAGSGVKLTIDADSMAAMDATGPLVADTGTGDQLAYVIHTSGSTGTPKGVMIGHRGVVNLSTDLAARLNWGPGEVIAAVAPHSFDMSVPELLTPLLCGAALRLIPRDHARDAALLAAELAEVTFAQLTPSHWQLLVDHGWSDRRLRAACGAEAFPPALASRLGPVVAELWNLYGPTETTVWSTAHRVREPGEGRPVPIGAPLANTVALVLDEDMRPVPFGVPGELYLGGAGVAWGYAGSPALTADRFVPDPFGPGRLYRTGDVVRRLADGALEFHSRTDHQVKVRGFRIELPEIEAVLERHPDVQRAAAAVRGEAMDGRVVAFVVLRDGATTDAVRRFAASLLPYYMVPSVLVAMPRLPLSPNGKVDRKALPREVAPHRRTAIEPRNARERAVAEAYQRVLRIESAGVDDDFFALGGHSLTAVQVVAALRETFGPAVTVTMLFDHPTVEALAERLTAPVTAPVPAAIGAAAGPAPLSPAQQRLWLLDRFTPGRVDYNVQRVLRLTGPLDADRLAHALDLVARRHDVLRTRFVVRDGVPGQQVDLDPPPLVRTRQADLAAATAVAATDIDTPFDLATGPLWRARLISLDGGDHVLVLVFHHSVVDGGSFPVLWRDIAAAYRCEPLPPLALTYADHARHQRAQPVLDDDLRYWRDLLDGHPASELPGDRPRPAVGAGRGAELFFPVGTEVAAGLRDLARACATTVFTVALAAFAVAVSRFGGSDDVVIGTPVSGRDRPEWDEVVGCFVNTMVLRVDCGGDPGFRNLITRAHATAAGAQAHSGVPFEQLVQELCPNRDTSRNPLFQIMFSIAADERVELPDLTATEVPVAATTTKFDLGVELRADAAQGYVGSIVWDTDLYDRQTIDEVAACYTALLRAVTSRPHQRLSELAPADPGPMPATPVPTVAVPDRVVAAAAARPAAIAVHCGQDTLTYAELARRSDVVARRLAEQGVRRGEVVSVVADGIDLPVLALGVSRAGAAFLPIDPADPRAPQLARAGRAAAELTAFEDGPAGRGVPVTAGDLLGVYFTSGSTGAAKAIHTTHGGVANFLDYLVELTGLGPDDVVLQLAAPGFDASLRDMLGPLTVGARTVMLPPGGRRDAYQVVRILRENSVTALLSVVPSMLGALIAASRGEPVDLRVILVSGEVLTPSLARDVAAWAPRARLVNQYGPSECTMTSTFHEVTAADIDAGTIPIGRPVPGVRAYVLGRHGEALPPGALGTLHLAGAGVSRGYGAAALTADRFVPDPHAGAGERMFDTGDLVHRRPDGVLVFHGRRDAQVKVRGVRIDPAEIEQVLLDCAGVDECVVTAPEGDLVAYVVGGASTAAIREELAARLPAPLRPAHLVPMDALPRLGNGKLDRRALPDPGRAAGTPVRTARDHAELAMVALWEKVLPGAVGIGDDFFAVGGNSLKAVELAEAVRTELGVTLPLHLLFNHPTVEQLCAVLPAFAGAEGRLAVRLKDGPDDVPPLFLVHPQSGEVCSYIDLVRQVEAGRAVYGLEAVGYNTDQPPLDSVEDMAERYLAEVRRLQPSGPYAFAGWSFGGNVAFEMAHRAELAGDTVEFLGVIDARAFGEAELEDWYTDKAESTRFGLVAGLEAERADELAELDEHQVLTRLLAHARDSGLVSPQADSATMRRMVDVFTANGRAAAGYRTRAVLSAGIDLFRATARHPTLTNPVVDPAAWQARTSAPLAVHEVDGTHHDVVAAANAVTFARRFVSAMTSRRQTA